MREMNHQPLWLRVSTSSSTMSSPISSLPPSPSSVAGASSTPSSPSSNPLFNDHLLPSLRATLSSLHALSACCLDPSLPGGKLCLHSDLDIAASALTVHLHDLHLLLRSGLLCDRAAAAVFLLAPASNTSRPVIFEEGALGPLLRLLDYGSSVLKERAAAAIQAVTADTACAWAVSTYGGVSVLVAAYLFDSGSSTVSSSPSLSQASAMREVYEGVGDEGLGSA